MCPVSLKKVSKRRKEMHCKHTQMCIAQMMLLVKCRMHPKRELHVQHYCETFIIVEVNSFSLIVDSDFVNMSAMLSSDEIYFGWMKPFSTSDRMKLNINMFRSLM